MTRLPASWSTKLASLRGLYIGDGEFCLRRRSLRHWDRILVPLAVLATSGNCSMRGCETPTESPPAAASAQAQPALDAKVAEALRAKGPNYVPRTRHRNADGSPRFTNRLIFESSPYLLQHAHNPVNWFPWGSEAFAEAARLGRPILLSVGYSTCHWCHVMEEESFEDEAIAAYLNENYVCIKVDREERPDVDAAYMSFVQALTGRGGWPMTVWLTPNREPFFGGTYFPPRAGARGAREGLLEIARARAARYASDPASVTEEAATIGAKLRAALEPESSGDLPGAELLSAGVVEAQRRFDAVMGGALGAPKFPSAFPLELLLRAFARTGEREALRMALVTLDKMHEGGIYDHAGGGFHRYSTDARWLVPHFEKMLYDNALLAMVYVLAGQASGEARYFVVAREVLDSLLRDMHAPDGTFYAATDADSLAPTGKREEGYAFTWTPAELRLALGSEDAEIARAYFGVTDKGQLDGRSVLHTERGADAVARELAVTVDVLRERLGVIRPKLLAVRQRRPAPLRDEKVLVAWNALAVSAFSRAASVLGDRRYADAAIRCATVLVAELRAGRPLPHQLVEGRSEGSAFADDLALTAAALLDVFELTSEPRWLSDAVELMLVLSRDFGDQHNGGYFLTSAAGERLPVRTKPDRDGPIPSVNSVAALTWSRLFTLTDEPRYRANADATVRAFSKSLSKRPLALDHLLHAVDWTTDAAKEIVIVVPEGRGALATDARPFLDVLARQYVPNKVLVVATESDLEGALARRVPWAKGKRLRQGRATAYVCERGVCQLPTTDPATFGKQLSMRAK